MLHSPLADLLTAAVLEISKIKPQEHTADAAANAAASLATLVVARQAAATTNATAASCCALQVIAADVSVFAACVAVAWKKAWLLTRLCVREKAAVQSPANSRLTILSSPGPSTFLICVDCA